jgi:DNA adenine methylase
VRSPVRWYGGKGQMLGKLLPLLPPHHTYCEPFAGGAAVFFAKAPAPVEVLNDVDSGLVNFYRVLRNPAMFAEFARLCALTPYSREEWEACKASWQAETDPILRAWRWFVWVRQTFGGGGQRWGGWQMVISESAGGMAHSVTNYLQAIDGLPAVHARLQMAQIEHSDWADFLTAYDTPATLFYCDPPYIDTARGRHRYAHDFAAADHGDLVARLLTLQGMAILSGYAHPLYTPLEAAGWQRIDVATAAHTVQTRGAGSGRDKAGRIESLWLNPACQAARMGPLFDLLAEVPA